MQSPFRGHMDPLATVRTEEHREKSSILPTLEVKFDDEPASHLTQHERKEEEIYMTMAQMPSRKIHLVEQKTDEQIKMEAEHRFRSTYDRLSLPRVEKRRQMIGLSPHAKVQLSKAQKMMRYKRQASLVKVANIISDNKVKDAHQLSM